MGSDGGKYGVGSLGDGNGATARILNRDRPLEVLRQKKEPPLPPAQMKWNQSTMQQLWSLGGAVQKDGMAQPPTEALAPIAPGLTTSNAPKVPTAATVAASKVQVAAAISPVVNARPYSATSPQARQIQSMVNIYHDYLPSGLGQRILESLKERNDENEATIMADLKTMRLAGQAAQQINQVQAFYDGRRKT
jgi:hypothetical protein